jgi:hypothetical protein
MILSVLLLLGTVALLVLAWQSLRAARGGGGPSAAQPRLVVELARGDDRPGLRLERGGAVLFGPIAAPWAPPPALSEALGNAEATAGRLGGAMKPGTYRVVALVDLSGADVLGSGAVALDEPLRKALGPSALLLDAAEGGTPLLLHGADGRSGGSLGGVSLPVARFAELVGMVGATPGLPMEIIRRRIQRAGWGGERAHRRRTG